MKFNNFFIFIFLVNFFIPILPMQRVIKKNEQQTKESIMNILRLSCTEKHKSSATDLINEAYKSGFKCNYALISIAQSGEFLDLFDLLIKCEVDINFKARHGKTALIYAASFGKANRALSKPVP